MALPSSATSTVGERSLAWFCGNPDSVNDHGSIGQSARAAGNLASEG
jgi:hypothetical protein